MDNIYIKAISINHIIHEIININTKTIKIILLISEIVGQIILDTSNLEWLKKLIIYLKKYIDSNIVNKLKYINILYISFNNQNKLLKYKFCNKIIITILNKNNIL